MLHSHEELLVKAGYQIFSRIPLIISADFSHNLPSIRHCTITHCNIRLDPRNSDVLFLEFNQTVKLELEMDGKNIAYDVCFNPNEHGVALVQFEKAPCRVAVTVSRQEGEIRIWHLPQQNYSMAAP